jgi:hypothetical protein
MAQLTATRSELLVRRARSTPSPLARGGELRRLVAIVGEAALSDDNRSYLTFAQRFEQSFVDQGGGRRSIEQTLDLAWELLALLPRADLKRIDPSLVERYGNHARPRVRRASSRCMAGFEGRPGIRSSPVRDGGVGP